MSARMTTNAGSFDEKLEVDSAAADSSNDPDVVLQPGTPRFIQNVMTDKGDHPLVEPAKVARRFGANWGDPSLIIFLHTWIKLRLEEYIIASWLEGLRLQYLRIRERFACVLEPASIHPYPETTDRQQPLLASGFVSPKFHSILASSNVSLLHM